MDQQTAETLLDALSARSGIVAAVGAGGKKTTLHRLVQAHLILGTNRIALTATVQTGAPPDPLDIITLPLSIESPGPPIPFQNGAFFLPGPARSQGRFSGLPADRIAALHDEGAFDVSLVKADGARMRMIKAPGGHEPALPDGATTILPVVSARVFGRPLSDKIAHRIERLAGAIGADLNDQLTPDHLARLLSSDEGALRRVGSAQVVPVINMVDTPERLALAREAAAKALAITDRFDRVVLASMTSPTPLVEVVSG